MRSLLLVPALLLALSSTGCIVVRTRGLDDVGTASQPANVAETSVYATPPDNARFDGVGEASENDEEAAAFFVEKSGSYWPAELLARLPDGRAAMHVHTSGSAEDEIVAPSRLFVDTSNRSAPRRGEHLFVEWHGSYWPAVVLSTDGDLARIRYDNYGSEWDETVGPDRQKRLSPSR
jgi:hypothetical protein